MKRDREREVGQGGDVAEECQGREVGVMMEVWP